VAAHGRSEGSSSSIDLNAVRETLHYIESDLNGPQYAQLRSIVGLALAEIGRIESKAEKEQLRAVHFVPVT
jgi:hypothetical protein